MAVSVGAVGLPGALLGAPSTGPPPATAPAAATAESACTAFPGYARLLETYVDAAGNVDYGALKEGRGELDRAVERLAGCDAGELAALPETGQIAYWLNAYNLFTLQVVVDHYPIEASFFGRLRFPAESIRQIDGVWTDFQVAAGGKAPTLDAIEHEILRVDFDEPRIHMALNCASVGCPPLRREPYRGAELDEQLDDQSRRFVTDPSKVAIRMDAGKVELSPIFDWFGEDFVGPVDPTPIPDRFGAEERAALAFVHRYVGREQQAYLATGNYSVGYGDYDWSLNGQAN